MAEKWKIFRYESGMKKEWDEFVSSSKNGTFLFQRDYMEYHSDRFFDFSLMAYKGHRMLALLPANISGDELHSHQGLTYGGWILPKRHLNGEDLLELWETWLDFCKDAKIKKIYYKPTPTIYHLMSAQEDLYALFRSNARIVGTNLSSSILLENNPGFNTLMRRHLRKAESIDTSYEETTDAEMFMQLTSECLKERFGASAVHTGEEMKFLKSRFPDNIRFFILKSKGIPMGGVCIYESQQTAHCQYIWTSPACRDLNLLPVLFQYLIFHKFADKRYFDFGTSNEEKGLILNTGLIRQKFSMGGSGIIHACYAIDL